MAWPMRISLAAGLTVLAAAAAATGSSAAAVALPNLVQAPPARVSISSVGGHWQLGFESAVSNTGLAPLLVGGSRPRAGVATMTAFQTAGGQRLGRIGVLHFDVDPTHSHWHLQPFETYELRRLGDGTLVTMARKAGFCLTDSRGLPGAGPPRHTALCGVNRPDLLRISEGISPGWADVYPPEREGQFLDITEVAAGRYLIVNRVNAGHAIRETRYDDDVAATAIDLEWPAGATGAPTLTVIGTCAGATVCATLGIR